MRVPAAAVVVLALAAGPAAAAVRPVSCRLVTDAIQDTYLVRPQEGLTSSTREDALDVVRVDAAGDGRTIAFGMRLFDLAKQVPSAPGGAAFRVQFRAAPMPSDELLYLEARFDATGAESFVAGWRNSRTGAAKVIGPARGVFDVARSEVRTWVPVAALSPYARLGKGARVDFTGLDQFVARQSLATPAGSGPATFADTATGAAAYVVGTPSCLPLGR